LLEITGTIEKVSRLLTMLEPFSIVEVQRTGVVAMLRGGEDVYLDMPLVAAGTNGQHTAAE
jgi:hypothetical protein